MRRATITVLALGFVLAGCSAVVDGHGTPVGSLSSPDFPSSSAPSGSAPSESEMPSTAPSGNPSAPSSDPGPFAGADFTCPDVTFPQAHMSFACVSDQLTIDYGGDPVFPIALAQTVEASTGWSLESSAATYSGSATSFPAIAADIRNSMINSGSYGDDPSVAVDSTRMSTISGRPAYTVADTVTLNPTWAAQQKTAVKIEKRWLVVIRYAPTTYVAWLATIPDLAQQYWSKVPSVIASIKLR